MRSDGLTTLPILILTMEKLYEEVLTSKQEIKSAIEASEVRLLLKIESYSEKIRKLERENSELKQQIEILDRNSRKNNIVVFGLMKSEEEPSVENLCNQLNTKLGVEIAKTDISNFYPLGKSRDCPIKVELVSTFTKNHILRNCKKLKGTNISISADRTRKQQETNKILRNYLKKIRDSGEEGIYIRGEKLYRNNIGYTAEDILEIEENCEPPDDSKAASAPETPLRPSAERAKKEENESEKAAKKIEEEEKEVKNKNSGSRYRETRSTQKNSK